jgi:prepilin-type N-terminal cleavage/methylation domain-containing protein/prepilin-type processing-associated H-X9-DG protein
MKRANPLVEQLGRALTQTRARVEARVCERGTRRRGFTLVELLAVIALIVLLAALILPVFGAARERARESTCLSHLRQINLAYLLYVADWEEQLPDWYLPGPPRPAPFGPRRFWPELLQPYLRSQGVVLDPNAVWEEQEDVRLADYTLMTSGPEGRGTEADPYWRWPGPPLSLADVRRPAETGHLLDGWTTTGWRLGPIWRHRGGLNVGFLDGHSAWLPVRELARVDTDGRASYWFHYGSADR